MPRGPGQMKKPACVADIAKRRWLARLLREAAAFAYEKPDASARDRLFCMLGYLTGVAQIPEDEAGRLVFNLLAEIK